MSAPSSLSWKIHALRALAEPDAPRVLDVPTLDTWLQTKGMEIPHRTLRRALSEWDAANLIGRAARGYFLNGQATPEPGLEEVAPLLREGAIVSLSTVLGRAGVLNNPTHWVTAVVSSDNTSKPANEMEADNGSVFKFATMRADLLPQLDRSDAFARDALEPYTSAPTATPEKALLDWLYISSRGRGASRWPLPPSHDWDIGDLDTEKLDRLAQRMGLEDELSQFRVGLEQQPRVRVRRTMRLG